MKLSLYFSWSAQFNWVDIVTIEPKNCSLIYTNMPNFTKWRYFNARNVLFDTFVLCIHMTVLVVFRQRPDLYRCSMCWRDESSLLIGYGDQVRVVQINTRAAHDVRDLPRTYAQISKLYMSHCLAYSIYSFYNYCK